MAKETQVKNSLTLSLSDSKPLNANSILTICLSRKKSVNTSYYLNLKKKKKLYTFKKLKASPGVLHIEYSI
jgi:flagellar basal body L-ring protein FlgH